VPPPARAGGYTMGFFPFISPTPCVVKLTLTRMDDPANLTNVPMGGGVEVVVGHSAGLEIAGGGSLGPSATPYLLSFESEGCGGEALLLLNNVYHRYTLPNASALKLVPLLDKATPTLLNFGAGDCKVNVEAKRLPVTHLPVQNPASRDFSVDFTHLESTVVTQDQVASPDWPVCGKWDGCDCARVELKSGSCSVSGFDGCHTPGQNLTSEMHGGDYNGTRMFKQRFDFHSCGSSQNCSGTVTFIHQGKGAC